MAFLPCLLSLIFIFGCSNQQINAKKEINKNYEASIKWRMIVQNKVSANDSLNHGPDIDSNEWCNTIDFKLFDRKSGLIPCSSEWVEKVSEILEI